MILQQKKGKQLQIICIPRVPRNKGKFLSKISPHRVLKQGRSSLIIFMWYKDGSGTIKKIALTIKDVYNDIIR